ncbi:MAG: DUF2141 domain-containing protein [Kofleriaceae bacterium]
MLSKLSLLVLVACHGTPSGEPQPLVEKVAIGSGITADQITVHVKDLRDDHGMVRCSLYDSGDAFPESQTHVIARAVSSPSSSTCVFRGVERAKDYAIVIHHDENNDNVFQKNALGIPEEGYGFSNDVRPKFSAPSFGDCKFHYDAGAVAMTIAMQY